MAAWSPAARETRVTSGTSSWSRTTNRPASAGAGAAWRRSRGVRRSLNGRGGRAGGRRTRPRPLRKLAADAAAGHPVALGALRQAGEAIGVAIASATSLCDLEVVSIGGGLSLAGEPLFGPLRDKLVEHAGLDFARGVRVMPAALGQAAGLIGAAALILARIATGPEIDAPGCSGESGHDLIQGV